MPTRFDTDVFYETHLEPGAIFSTETVAVRNVPPHEIKAVTDGLDLTAERFNTEISFYDLEPLTVVYRAYGPTAAGAVLWLQDQAVATLGLLDRGHEDGIHDFHQVLTNLAQRSGESTRVISRARLPTCRPALFVVGMDGWDVANNPGLHRFIHALMVAFLYHHQRAWHARQQRLSR